MAYVPYVVLIGDVGTGKSTIVEKLTGERGLSDDSELSKTRVTQLYWVKNRSFFIADTPGANAIEDKLEHNVWIASAFSFAKVSRILIIVKAETRIDNVIDNVRKYAERLLDVPQLIIGVLVTHMDKVDWKEKRFLDLLNNEIGNNTVIFSSMDKPDASLCNDILSKCSHCWDYGVDTEVFLKVFKIHNNNMKILRCTRTKLEYFKQLKEQFDKKRQDYSGQELIDLVFEFQAWVIDSITQAQQELASENNFTFFGDGAANEAGHVANMTNQLMSVLLELRVEMSGFQGSHGVSELRKCPHCGAVWMKIEGCDGETNCGSRPSSMLDSSGEMATFAFEFAMQNLHISKIGVKTVAKVKKTKQHFGCGKLIDWQTMCSVEVPPDISRAVEAGTGDVKMLAPSQGTGFKRDLNKKLVTCADQIKKNFTQ